MLNKNNKLFIKIDLNVEERINIVKLALWLSIKIILNKMQYQKLIMIKIHKPKLKKMKENLY